MAMSFLPTHGAQKTGPHLALQDAPFMVRARDKVLWRSLVLEVTGIFSLKPQFP